MSAGEDGTCRIWSLSTGACLNVLAGHEGLIHIRSIAINRKGTVLVRFQKTFYNKS